MSDHEAFARWGRSHPALVDAAIAALVLAAFEMPAFDPYRHAGGPWWPLWGLSVSGSLLWRRRLPVPVLAVSLVGTMGALLTRVGPDWGGLSVIAILLGPSVALATAAASAPIERSQRLAGGSAAAVVITMAVRRSVTPDVVAAQVAVIAAAWLAGEAIKARRHEIALLRDLVSQRTEQAANEERARIARELHDVVAHHLSVIAVHAGAARLGVNDGSQTAAGLATIEEASRQALIELRRALGVLRHDEPGGGVSPQPGLDQLDRLADRLRDAGLPLQLTITGDDSNVPDGIAVSAYRIVQEALTNVLNHAGRVTTRVDIAYSPTHIQLDVLNNRPAISPTANGDGGGRGLIGMRERVAAYGGSLQTGAVASGGFHVTARIPLQ